MKNKESIGQKSIAIVIDTSQGDFDGFLRLTDTLMEKFHVRPLLAAHVIEDEGLFESSHLEKHFRLLVRGCEKKLTAIVCCCENYYCANL